MVPTLVDPGVTRRKFIRELEDWKQHASPEKRGWLLLQEDLNVPYVDIAFLGKVAMGPGVAPLSVVGCAIRLSYQNYDLWPPSLTFIDPHTRKESPPSVNALMMTSEGVKNVLIGSHPNTNRPFLCLPGIREYHEHPQHTGDSWLLHRHTKVGNITTICDRVWRLMARNPVFLILQSQSIMTNPPQIQVGIKLMQIPDGISIDHPLNPAGEAQR